MLLALILFGLVTVGFVVPCLIDVAVTPPGELHRLTKPAWVMVIVFFSAFGATAWLLVGRPDRRGRMLPGHMEDAPFFGPQDALRRHPAGRGMDTGIGGPSGRATYPASAATARPMGPDDDPEFLEELARRIERGRGAGNDA
jgi:Phospholipase_D-nuclease N-terminal